MKLNKIKLVACLAFLSSITLAGCNITPSSESKVESSSVETTTSTSDASSEATSTSSVESSASTSSSTATSSSTSSSSESSASSSYSESTLSTPGTELAAWESVYYYSQVANKEFAYKDVREGAETDADSIAMLKSALTGSKISIFDKDNVEWFMDRMIMDSFAYDAQSVGLGGFEFSVKDDNVVFGYFTMTHFNVAGMIIEEETVYPMFYYYKTNVIELALEGSTGYDFMVYELTEKTPTHTTIDAITSWPEEQVNEAIKSFGFKYDYTIPAITNAQAYAVMSVDLGTSKIAMVYANFATVDDAEECVKSYSRKLAAAGYIILDLGSSSDSELYVKKEILVSPSVAQGSLVAISIAKNPMYQDDAFPTETVNAFLQGVGSNVTIPELSYSGCTGYSIFGPIKLENYDMLGVTATVNNVEAAVSAYSSQLTRVGFVIASETESTMILTYEGTKLQVMISTSSTNMVSIYFIVDYRNVTE